MPSLIAMPLLMSNYLPRKERRQQHQEHNLKRNVQTYMWATFLAFD
jgi:hypothetical protein